MTNSLIGRMEIRMGKGGLAKNAKVETLQLLRKKNRISTKFVIAAVVGVAVISGLGITNTSFTIAAHHNVVTSKQCLQTPVKMFDESNVPKYFIGSGYKITPIDPKVTDVMVPICK